MSDKFNMKKKNLTDEEIENIFNERKNGGRNFKIGIGNGNWKSKVKFKEELVTEGEDLKTESEDVKIEIIDSEKNNKDTQKENDGD